MMPMSLMMKRALRSRSDRSMYRSRRHVWTLSITDKNSFYPVLEGPDQFTLAVQVYGTYYMGSMGALGQSSRRTSYSIPFVVCVVARMKGGHLVSSRDYLTYPTRCVFAGNRAAL